MDEWLSRLLDAIPGRMAELKTPGCALAVIEHGAVAERRWLGRADSSSGEPVLPETRFSLQSISKSVAAWAVMALAEQGRLDLDAPIDRYLKRWRLPPSERFDLDLVTPRRLLSHHAGVTTAGFRGVQLHQTSYTLIDAMNAALPEPDEAQRRHWTYWNLPDDEPVSVTHAPGEAWRYSNAGFALLELAIEDITGESYAEFASRTVLAPLGMKTAVLGRRPDTRCARPHGRDGEPCPDYRWLTGAAAGVYATVDDLATFALAGMTSAAGEPPGRGVLTPGSVRMLYSSHGDADQSGGAPFQAGLGHVLLVQDGVKNVHHSGGSIGWRSIFSIFPEAGSGICMLMNGEAANDLWIPLVREWRDETFRRLGERAEQTV